jgi:hypothetical protein
LVSKTRQTCPSPQPPIDRRPHRQPRLTRWSLLFQPSPHVTAGPAHPSAREPLWFSGFPDELSGLTRALSCPRTISRGSALKDLNLLRTVGRVLNSAASMAFTVNIAARLSLNVYRRGRLRLRCGPLSCSHHVAFDAGLRPGPFPDQTASLLPGSLAITRTGLSPAGDDELPIRS